MIFASTSFRRPNYPDEPRCLFAGPSHSVRRGKGPVFAPDEAWRLLHAIDVITPAGLRDRALIGLMVYSFARISAPLGMPIEDVFVQNRRLWGGCMREAAASAMRCRANII